MENKFFDSRIGLNIYQQAFRISQLYPQFKATLTNNKGIWTGVLKPFILSEEYCIQIIYKLKTPPKVKILYPKLQGRSDNKPIPHLYCEKNLCLYLPNNGEWDANKFIANSIIPWASLWLGFYEIWHITGDDWKGGGLHPEKK